MQNPDAFIRSLLSAAQGAQQPPMQAPVAPPMPIQQQAPMPAPAPTPVPQPQVQQNPAGQLVAAALMERLLSPQQFTQGRDFSGVAPLLGSARPTMGIQQEQPQEDYSGDWVVVDVGPRGAGTTPIVPGTDSQTLIFMPAANAADVPPDAIVTTISNDPAKIEAAQGRGQLLSQQDASTQIYFQTKEQRDDNLYQNKAASDSQHIVGGGDAPLVDSQAELDAIQSQPDNKPASQPPNALGQTPDQVMAGSQDFEQLQQDLRTKPQDVVIREQAEKYGTDTPAGYKVKVLRTSDLRDQGMTAEANELENNGIFEVSTGEMVVRGPDGRVQKVPYLGEDQKIPDGWTVIVYGGKEEAPSNIRDEKRGGIRIPIISDITGVEIPAGALPNGVVDVANMPSGVVNAVLGGLGSVQQGNVSNTAETWMEDPSIAQKYREDNPDPKLAYSYGGMAPFEVWMAYNYDDAQFVYKNGYTDPKTGETFTGGRAVWEKFQADRSIFERGLDVIATDPLNAATGGTGEAVSAVGRAAEKVPVVGRAVGAVLDETGRFVDNLGKEGEAAAGKIVGGAKRVAGTVIKPNEAARVEVGAAGRTGARETETTIDDVLGSPRQERRDIGTDLPVAEPDTTRPGTRTVDLGNGSTARASMDGTWNVFDRDGKRVVANGSWDDVTASQPYQTALRDRGVDPRDVGLGDETPAQVAPEAATDVARQADTTDVVRTAEQEVPQVRPEPSASEVSVPLGQDLTAERNGPLWNVVNRDGDVVAEARTWASINREFTPDAMPLGQADSALAPATQENLPGLEVGADRTANNLKPDPIPTGETPVQTRLRSEFENLGYLSPQERGARAASRRDMRSVDRVLELAKDYPMESRAFLDDYRPLAEARRQADQATRYRRGDAGFIENTPGVKIGNDTDGFAIRKAQREVDNAAHYVDDILPTWDRHFEGIEPAPDYAFQRKPGPDASKAERNWANQTPEQLIERYIFTENEADAARARNLIESKYVYKKDANGNFIYGADGQRQYAQPNRRHLAEALDKATQVRERYIGNRIASDATAPIDGAVREAAPVPVEAPAPRPGMTQGQAQVVTQAAPERPAVIPGLDRGVARATDLDSTTGDYYFRNAAVSESQAKILRQTFSDGERMGDRLNRYIDEIKAETPKQQRARYEKIAEPQRTIASDTARPQRAQSLFGEVDAVDGVRRLTDQEIETIAKQKVLAEWGYENLSDKGKAKADEWYAKYRKTMSDESARDAAVRRAASSQADNKVLRAYDRMGQGLRGNILYNVFSAPRTIMQQNMSNTLLAALKKEKGMLDANLSPVAVTDAWKKIRAEGVGDEAYTAMDRKLQKLGLSGKREYISGTPATRDQVELSIDALQKRRERTAKTKLGWKDFNIFNSRAVRDAAGASDLLSREALYTSFMDYAQIEGKAALRTRMEARLPAGLDVEGFRAQFDGLGHDFSPQDIRETFGEYGQNWADRGARDWQETIVKADKAASDHVKSIMFDGTMTNADDVARRLVFFHYWMSRAMPMYTAMIARDPVYLLNYTRMVEAMKKENDAKSYISDGFLSWLMTPMGYNIAIRPDVFFPTFKDAWDDAGYAPDGENWLGKLFREVGFMPHPVIGTALNMLGMMGDTFAPDPTGTGRLRRLATEGVDYYKTVTGTGDATPTRDPSNDLLLKGRAWITDHLDWVPGIDALPYKDSMVYTEREITNIMIDIAKERGIDVESPEFIAATEDPESDLRREAFDRWSTQNAVDVGLSVSPVSPFYPKSTLISPKERNDRATAMRDSRVGTSYTNALPAEQQMYDENDIANTIDPQAKNLKQQQNEYHSLGTQRQQAGIDYYNGIRYGYTEEVIHAGGYDWTPAQIAAMSKEDRTSLADMWAEEAGYTDDINAIREERKAYRDAHPDYADYVTWAGSVRDYEGGPSRYWEKTAEVNPSAAEWYGRNPNEAGLTSVDAYLAYKGIASDYRQPGGLPVRDQSAIPADAYSLDGTSASSGTGSSTGKPKATGPSKEGIQKGIAEYQQRQTEYLDMIEKLWGQRVDPAMMDPATRGYVERILRDNYGMEPPYISGQAKGYLEWAAAQEGPSSIDDYLTWYTANQQANPAPTGEDIQGVDPQDAQVILSK